MRHVFRPIPGFPDYEISNTGWVLSLPRTVWAKNESTAFFPGAIMSPWLMGHKFPVVTIRNAKGIRRNVTISILLRRVWNLPMSTAQRIAFDALEGRSERPKPVTIYRGEPIPSDELRARIGIAA